MYTAVSRKVGGKKDKSARDNLERYSEYLVINEFLRNEINK